ncbi:hypothetical protein RJ639_039870 [Escallonia herrerae]|uniref:Reverse transcriptase RNase H-like domain-containing protein n=1 Tax=Escallonia herrerae TaxID=1293975 RepID=A0AA89BAR2_9ASTE|nr:hypothetical protein RJ639_039870 [Escallonia herrerae]
MKTPHDDPIVIMIKAGNFDVKHVLVDNGSFAKVLFYDAFKKTKIPTDRLRKMDTPLYGFSNHPVLVKGIIALPVAIGTPPTQANFMFDFVVVKVPSAYNAILGRPTLNQLQAVVSTYHLKMKFPTEYVIGKVKGDQTTVHEKKTVRISSNLKEDIKFELVNLLRTYADVFAWTAQTCLELILREEDGVQKPIYYVSKVLQDVKTRYPKIDKIALALIISARRLRPYFQSHATVILTDQPVRKVLLGLEASGRLTVLQPLVVVEQESFSSAQKVSPLSELPSERHEVRNLHVKAAQYALVEGVLYKKSFNLSYLRCLRPSNILQGLKKRLDEAKGAWLDELPKVLWTYRTTPHSITGETPFLLCYGTEAMLPVEIGVPTIRALHFNEEHNEVELRTNLDLVEEA